MGDQGKATSATEPLQPPNSSIATAIVACSVLSSFLFGYTICVLNSCGELIAVVLRWCGNSWQSDCFESEGAQALVNASLYLGAAIGAILFGHFAFLGARKQMILSDVCWFLGALTCCIAGGMRVLIVGRFISGLGLGLSAIAAPLAIAEISPKEVRGFNAALHGTFITVGILASIVFGLPQGPPPSGPWESIEELDTWYWRALLCFPALPALLQALFFGVVYPIDSPAFLVARGRVTEARLLLYRTYGLVPLGDTVSMTDHKAAALELQLNEIKEADAEAKDTPEISIWAALFKEDLSFAILLGFGLAAYQQLCGINGLMAYSNSLFREAGITPAHLTLASTAMGTANVAASAFSASVVDHWGRKQLLSAGSFCQGLAMALLSMSIGGFSSMLTPSETGLMAVACFSLFVMSFSFGLGAVTWIYLSEIYPIQIRSSVLSACGVINWISSFVVVFGTRFLNLWGACCIFGMISAMGFFATYFWVIETKGCSMSESPLITPSSPRIASPGSPRTTFEQMVDEDDDDFRRSFSPLE